jgi:hypothetical protein
VYLAGDPKVPCALPALCPNCDYDLRGLSSDRCPECGLVIDRIEAFAIPWEFRGQIGRVRAFLRTARLATFQPKRLASATLGPVDARSAARFRWTIVAAASIIPMFVLGGVVRYATVSGLFQLVQITWVIDDIYQSRTWEPLTLWLAGITILGVLPAGVFITFLLATASSRLWFGGNQHSAERSQRARCIASYACAPLVWSAPAAAMYGVYCFHSSPWKIEFERAADVVGGSFFDQTALVLMFLSIGVAGLALIAWWFTTLRLMQRTTRCGMGRITAAAVGIPIGWLACAAVGVGIWPSLVGLVWIAIDGFRS